MSLNSLLQECAQFVTLIEPYRTLSFFIGAYRLNGSPFTVPYRFLFYFSKARSRPLQASIIFVFLVKNTNRRMPSTKAFSVLNFNSEPYRIEIGSVWHLKTGNCTFALFYHKTEYGMLFGAVRFAVKIKNENLFFLVPYGKRFPIKNYIPKLSSK